MDINKLIDKARSSYLSYSNKCDDVAKEAQKHINWDDDIGCEYIPSDGICLTTTDNHVCPATLFFKLVEEKGNISQSDLKSIYI